MAKPIKIDQIEQGQERLLDQFKGKPNIEGTLAAYTKQTNDLENTFFDLIGDRSLDTAIGYQLDVIGAIVGEARKGKSDDDFRIAIQFKINVNNSHGTPEELMASLKEVTLSTDVNIFEHYPVSYMMSFDGLNIPDNFVDYFQASSIATCNIGLLHDKEGGGWIGQDLGDTSQEAKAIFGDVGDSSALFLVDLYNDGLGGTGIAQDFDITTCYNSQVFSGNGTEIDIDVGFDISDNKSISFIKCITGINAWEEAISPFMGINKFRRMGVNTGSIRSLGVTAFGATGFTLEQDVLLPAQDRFNHSLEAMTVNTFRSKEGFCDVIEWTGDGTLQRQLPHNCKKNVAAMLFFPKVNTGAAQREVYWFKGMSGTEYISNSVLTENVSIWASTLPNNVEVTVGFDAGANNLNEDGIEYMGIIFADAPENGVSVIEYQSTDTLADELVLPYNVGFSLIRGASQATTAIFDEKAGASRSRRWASSVSGTDPDLYYNVNKNSIFLGNSTSTNSSGGTGRYFCLTVKSTKGLTKKQGVIPDLDTKFSVTNYTGNLSNNDVLTGVDLLNNEGLILHWDLVNSLHMNYYSKVHDAAAISQLGVKGFKTWLSGSSGFAALGDFTLTNNSFSMTAASSTSWNGSGGKYLATCIKESLGFMDVITWTGDGTARQEIPHSLGKEVALLIVQGVDVGAPNNAQMWFKGMPADSVMTYTSTVTVGSIFAGTAPTSTEISVGSIGGNFDMNKDGTEYVGYVFADDPAVGITAGSYTASGLDGQLVDIENRLGLFMCRNFNNGLGVVNTYKTGTSSKTFQVVSPTSAYISGIDIDGTKIRIPSHNSFTNDTGVTHYWFNIANPTQ
jgi:hypothetical protein